MSEQSADKETKPTKPPEQKLGDTPVAPWNMPTPEEKAAAKPLRRALRDALSTVDSQEKADAVMDELATATVGETTADVQKTQPPPTTPEQATQQVEQPTQAAPVDNKVQTVLTETARVITTAKGRELEMVAEAAQEVLNPEQQGAPGAGEEPQRRYLRQAVLKRLKPLDALDATLFLRINHLPHTRWLNSLFYGLTFAFTGGAAWFWLMGLIFLRNQGLGWQVIRKSALPLALATSLVEYPIKSYFRRRRPFIDLIQAIVIGKKPGTWSFPSGHSATAFAGAWLLSSHFPRWRGLFYTLASLVGFSRIYLGDHYPGDVVSGATLGTLFAMILQRLPWPWRPKP